MYLSGDRSPAILTRERSTIDVRLRELARKQAANLEAKQEAAEQSGDNWHDGAFRATDDVAKVLGNQAQSLVVALDGLLVDMPCPGEDRVSLGTQVHIRHDDSEYSLCIVGVPALHPSGEVDACSLESPMARSLIGRRAGEHFTAHIAGRTAEITILSVSQEWAEEALSARGD